MKKARHSDDHSLIRRRLYGVAGVFSSALAIGAVGYHLIEGWNFLDSVYMTVITLATVGYGEVHPLSSAGRVFTIFLILFGVGTLAYALSAMTAFIVEGELKDALRRRRMDAEIAKLKDHYILCGAGHTGLAIIEELQKTRRAFVAIEKDPARVEYLRARKILAIVGDATDDEILQRAGIERAKGLFTALPNDPDNVYVTIGAKGLNRHLRVVSRQRDPGGREKLHRSGADTIVNPGLIGGLRMASEMIRPAAVGFIDSMIRLGKTVRIEEVTVPEGSPLKGMAMDEIKGAQGNAALILAVMHPHHKTYELNPDPKRKIEVGEVLVAMGTLDEIKELTDKVAA